MNDLIYHLNNELNDIKKDGLFKDERVINSPQNTEIVVKNKNVLNFCANNYLGLSNNQDLIKAAQDGLNNWGLGLSSVRFICGTQTIHKELEEKIKLMNISKSVDSSQGDIKATRLKINEYVREIDKCIALLNK